MQKYLLFAFSLLLTTALVAQTPTQTIRGRVSDKITRQPIPGAAIIIPGSSPLLGTVSDEKGLFRLEKVALGRVAIECSFVGYETWVSQELILGSAKELVLEIELEEGLMLEGVEVRAGAADLNAPVNESALVSARSFSVEETERIPASVNDPGRMALAFPGVQKGGNDTENDIIIRGNSSFGVLWRLEGLDIPNPNHFARPGTSGGGITVFSASLLARSDFSTGGMSAEYGNALSGAFDVRFRAGNQEQREYRIRTSLLGLDFATEGPLQKSRSSYLFNYRYSTLGLLNKMGFHLVGERVSNDFQDFSFNLTFDGKDERSKFTVFGVGGLSLEHYTPVEVPEERDPGRANHWEDRRQGSNMGVVGATFTRLLQGDAYLRLVVGAMGSFIFRQYDTLDLRDRPFRYNTQDYYDNRVSAALTYSARLGERLRLKTGAIAHQVFFDFFKETSPRNSRTDIGQQQSLLSVDGGGATQTLQTYGQLTWKPGERWTLHSGLHLLHLTLNGSSALDPRFSASYQISPAQRLSLALGRHSQMLPLAAYFFNTGQSYPNRHLPMIYSRQAVLGYSIVTPAKLKVTLEGYAQWLANVPVEPRANSTYWMLNNQSEFPEFAVRPDGTGTNKGTDLTIEKFFSNQFYFLVTGSLLDGRFTAYDGRSFHTRFSNRWATTYTVGREFAFRKGGVLQVGTRILRNGGFRYSPHDPVASAFSGRYVELEGAQWSAQVPAYMRFDGRIAWRKNRPRYTFNLSLDIQNLSGRDNINSVGYDPLRNATYFSAYDGSDFIPILGAQWDF